MTSKLQRQRYLDVAKGIGIFLVIVGHCIPDASTPEGISDKNFAVLFGVIYSFHMPLFFFVSGYLTKNLETSSQIFAALKKKFNRLMVPYFFVGACYLPFKLLLSQFANSPLNLDELPKIFLGVNPDGELWFLYALFVSSAALLFFGNRINFLGLILSLVLAIVDLRTNFLPTDIFWFLFFFALGAYVRQNHPNLFKDIGAKEFAVAVILFVIGNYMLKNFDFREWQLITSLSGIVICICVSLRLAEVNSLPTQIIETAGLFSMDLYILSDIVKIPFRIIFWNGLHWYTGSFVICVFCGVVISFLISKYFIRRNKFFSAMILGVQSERRTIH